MRISKYCIYEIVLFHIFLAIYALTFYRKDEWEISLFLLFLIFVLLILEYCRIKLFVSPLFFWFAFWLGAITIGRMNLGIGVYPLYRDWTERLLRIIVFNTLVFFWAYWLGENCCFLKKTDKNQIQDINGEMLATIVIFLLMIACCAFLVNVAVTGVVPQLTRNANAYRSSFVATRFYQIVSVLRFVLACVPISFKMTTSRTKKILLIILTGAYCFNEMLTGWRGYTLQGMILLLTSYFLSTDTKQIKTRRNNIILAVFSALFIFVFIVIVTITRDGSFDRFESRIRYAIENFYMYIAPNFLNFQSAVEKVEPKGFFMYSLEAFWGVFISPAENPQFVWYDVEYNIGAYNVCTYLLEPFCDLGVFGTAIWSGLIAVVSGKAFRSFMRNNNITVSVMLGILNITIFYFHNNFFLRSSSIVLWIVAGCILEYMIEKRTFLNG